MKTHAIVCTIVAASLSCSGLAFAQQDKDLRVEPPGRAPQVQLPARGPDRAPQRAVEPRRDDRRDQVAHDRGWREQEAHDRGWRDDRRDERRGDAYRRGAGPDHNYYRGGHLPMQYRSHQYVVDDWRGHRLSAPPRGYNWVQVGGDYVLVAIATGIIASILLNQ